MSSSWSIVPSAVSALGRLRVGARRGGLLPNLTLPGAVSVTHKSPFLDRTKAPTPAELDDFVRKYSTPEAKRGGWAVSRVSGTIAEAATVLQLATVERAVRHVNVFPVLAESPFGSSVLATPSSPAVDVGDVVQQAVLLMPFFPLRWGSIAVADVLVAKYSRHTPWLMLDEQVSGWTMATSDAHEAVGEHTLLLTSTRNPDNTFKLEVESVTVSQLSPVARMAAPYARWLQRRAQKASVDQLRALVEWERVPGREEHQVLVA